MKKGTGQARCWMLEDLDHQLAGFRERLETERPVLPRDVDALISYIHRHLFNLDLNVKTAKIACKINNNNISARFRYFLGVGIRDYIEGLRMEAACLLLGLDGLPILDLAMTLGYEHQQTFYRAFRRTHGCTPCEWRERLDSSPSVTDFRGVSDR